MHFSIIVPIYNVEKYLVRSLDSIINQNYRNIEIILINDGSTDNSINILSDYSSRDNRIKVVNQPNLGLSAARNKGLSIATGEYILFVDADDFIELDTCSYLKKTMENHDYDIVVFGRYLYYDNGERREDNACSAERIFDNGLSYLQYSKVENHFSASACNKVYKSLFLKKYALLFEKGLFYEDLLFNFQAFTNAHYVIVLARNLYNYYVERSDSIVNTVKKKDLDVLYTISKIDDIYQSLDCHILEEFYYRIIIYDWVSNAVTYKYSKRYLFNYEAISLVMKILKSKEFFPFLKYCSSHLKVGFRRMILSWIQLNFSYFSCFIIWLLYKIKKMLS